MRRDDFRKGGQHWATHRTLIIRATASTSRRLAVYVKNPSPELVRHFRVGDEVPVSGDYDACHLVDGRTQRVFLSRGNLFPCCLACGEAVRFEVVAAELSPNHRQSSIMVHRLPHPDPEPAGKTPEGRQIQSDSRKARRAPGTRANRLRFGEYYADIIRDVHDPSIWIYVIQRKGSPDVLAMGTSTSKQQACELATGAMQHLGGSHAAIAS